MQVGAGNAAGSAYLGDDVALFNPLRLFSQDFMQMHIRGGQAVAVVDDQELVALDGPGGLFVDQIVKAWTMCLPSLKSSTAMISPLKNCSQIIHPPARYRQPALPIARPLAAPL